MTVSIKQLKAFVAVVEEKSFSQAAERLNATQSGMSMLVQNLELSVGKNLIKRIPGNMKLTDSGEEFYKSSIDILKPYIDGKSKEIEKFASQRKALIPSLD